MTPKTIHYGEAQACSEDSQRVLDLAHKEHPERFPKGAPKRLNLFDSSIRIFQKMCLKVVDTFWEMISGISWKRCGPVTLLTPLVVNHNPNLRVGSRKRLLKGWGSDKHFPIPKANSHKMNTLWIAGMNLDWEDTHRQDIKVKEKTVNSSRGATKDKPALVQTIFLLLSSAMVSLYSWRKGTKNCLPGNSLNSQIKSGVPQKSAKSCPTVTFLTRWCRSLFWTAERNLS